MKPAETILLADDNIDDVFLLQQAFRKAGVPLRLQVVSDGQDLLAYLNGAENYADRAANPLPDVVLLDLNMPRKNGFEALHEIRRHQSFSQLVVHVLTASARETDARRAYELGANSYVTKPTRLEDLVGFVKALQDWHRFAWPSPPPARARDASTP